MRKPHRVSAYEAVDPVPSQEGSCEKIGRASLLASHRRSKSLPHQARREPRPPGLGRFEIFFTAWNVTPWPRGEALLQMAVGVQIRGRAKWDPGSKNFGLSRASATRHSEVCPRSGRLNIRNPAGARVQTGIPLPAS